jgi:hypothetical protein
MICHDAGKIWLVLVTKMYENGPFPILASTYDCELKSTPTTSSLYRQQEVQKDMVPVGFEPTHLSIVVFNISAKGINMTFVLFSRSLA